MLTNTLRWNARAQQLKDIAHQHTSMTCETVEGNYFSRISDQYSLIVNLGCRTLQGTPGTLACVSQLTEKTSLRKIP